MSETVTTSWTPAGKNIAVITALLPVSFYAVASGNLCSLATIIVSIASCICFEALIQKLLKQKILINDFSAAASGLILALLLPSSIALWQVVTGALVAMVVAKAFFGGNGSYVFSPVLIGRAFMFVSFKTAFSAEKWLIPSEAGMQAVVVTLLLAAAFVYLVVIRVINPVPSAAFVAVLAASYAIAFAVTGQSPLENTAVQMASGAILFLAVFVMTDSTILPDNLPGQILYGTGAALLTWLITVPGKTSDGAMFAILIMNAVAPYFASKTVKEAAK